MSPTSILIAKQTISIAKVYHKSTSKWLKRPHRLSSNYFFRFFIQASTIMPKAITNMNGHNCRRGIALIALRFHENRIGSVVIHEYSQVDACCFTPFFAGNNQSKARQHIQSKNGW
jgi:hypothetical protein